MSDPAPEPEFRVPAARTGGAAGRVLTAVFATLVLGVWGSALLVRLGVTLPWPLLLPVAVLPWAAAALLVVGFSLWTAFPDRPSLPAWLTGAFVVPLAWWGPTWAASTTDQDGHALRVVTWNLARLEAPEPGVDDVATCVGDTLRGLAPDVVLMQEASLARAEAIVAHWSARCVHVPYQDKPAVGPTEDGHVLCFADRDGATWQATRVEPIEADPGGRWHHLHTVLQAQDASVDLFGVHLASHRVLQGSSGRFQRAVERFGRVQERQLGQVHALLAALPPARPVVVAGDFNASADLPTLTLLRGRLVDTWAAGAIGLSGTVHPFGLPLRVDHVLASPDVGVARAAIPAAPCSDHRPVVVDLVIPFDTP